MGHERAKKGIRKRHQIGAAMVEFAVTLLLFLTIVMAIFEFVIMIMAFSRANEATRDLVRIAIVSDPIVDIAALECDDETTTADPISTTLSGGSVTAERLFGRAQTQLPEANRDQVQVQYECANGNTGPIMVTVTIQNRTHDLILPDLLGLPSQIPLPSFSTSRVGESLETLNRPD